MNPIYIIDILEHFEKEKKENRKEIVWWPSTGLLCIFLADLTEMLGSDPSAEMLISNADS